jgi:hypothetical protein
VCCISPNTLPDHPLCPLCVGVVLLGSAAVHDELVEVREEQARLLASNLLPRDLAPPALQLPAGDLADWRRGLRAGPAISRTVGARYRTGSAFHYRTYHTIPYGLYGSPVAVLKQFSCVLNLELFKFSRSNYRDPNRIHVVPPYFKR